MDQPPATLLSCSTFREDILVFMTGQEEIENMARQVRTIAKEYQDRPRLEVRIFLLEED